MRCRRFVLLSIAGMAAVLFCGLPEPACSGQGHDARAIERIAPESAKKKLDSGRALLVCSYDDQKCSQMMIPGAITKDALARKRSSLSKDREIIFYCG